jgi:dTDP-4-amino-4,6-dideoxygalactose transaminase
MIRLAIPDVSGNEGHYLNECVETNFVSSVGPFVTRFEAMCAQATQSSGAVAVSSGTTGLQLALTTVGVGRDDLVILPTFTFIASANAISHCGASPWLFDVSAESWTLDPGQLRETVARETRRERGRLIHGSSGRRVAAIMPVYTLGHPADMEAIVVVAQEYGLPVISDAAAALGATYRGRALGGLADLSVASFNGNKTVTAGGGGAVFGMDEQLLARARHLSTTARIGQAYEHDAIGFNFRMTNIQAAVGCAQMERLEEFVSAKRRIDSRYRRELGARLKDATFGPRAEWADSACWFSSLVLPEDTKMLASEVCASVAEEQIEVRTFWKPVHLQRPYAQCLRATTAVSERLWSRVLSLPCSTSLSEDDQSRVIAALLRVLDG